MVKGVGISSFRLLSRLLEEGFPHEVFQDLGGDMAGFPFIGDLVWRLPQWGLGNQGNSLWWCGDTSYATSRTCDAGPPPSVVLIVGR
jgi:hypothetical protein